MGISCDANTVGVGLPHTPYTTALEKVDQLRDDIHDLLAGIATEGTRPIEKRLNERLWAIHCQLQGAPSAR